jgi:hypothetical protein
MKTIRLITCASALIVLLGFSACQSHEEKGPAVDSTQTAADAMNVDPVQPDKELRVDIGRWYDMTFSDFTRQYVSFSTEQPVVRDFGICDSLEVFFPDESTDAKPEILICHLNGVYTVDDAFTMLGIEIGEVADTEGQWISLASQDKRFAGLKFQGLDNYPDRTMQLLLQFARE